MSFQTDIQTTEAYKHEVLGTPGTLQVIECYSEAFGPCKPIVSTLKALYFSLNDRPIKFYTVSLSRAKGNVQAAAAACTVGCSLQDLPTYVVTSPCCTLIYILGGGKLNTPPGRLQMACLWQIICNWQMITSCKHLQLRPVVVVTSTACWTPAYGKAACRSKHACFYTVACKLA